MKRALSIAGFDPTGWAGILADVKVFTEMGLMASAVVTALTVQDLTSVREVAPVELGLLRGQIESLFNGKDEYAVKIGMLGSGEIAGEVARLLEESRPPVIVLDPVLASTAGTSLAGERGLEVIRDKLIPLATLVTPNIREASLITGVSVDDAKGMREAAVVIFNDFRAGAVLIKGGHLGGAPIDILYDGSQFIEFEGLRLKGPVGLFHGTGCILSSAITAGLAQGRLLGDAVEQAKRYTEKILKERIF